MLHFQLSARIAVTALAGSLAAASLGAQSAVLFVGLAFIDVMNVLINQQFVVAMRQDATVSFVEPRSSRAMFAVSRLPGVMDLEPMRNVPVRLRAGHRTRTLAITGLPASPQLNRVVDRRAIPFRSKFSKARGLSAMLRSSRLWTIRWGCKPICGSMR
jgi:putative ABC transport system permease protein